MSNTVPHAAQSVLREHIVEHVFVGELLRRLWQRGVTDVEVLRAEFDAGGYDLVLSRGAVVRHLQLKTIVDGGQANHVVINHKLALKPSGCVLWIVVNHALNLLAYRWYGAPPGEPLPDLQHTSTARHMRANADGIKQARPGHRVLRLYKFKHLDNLDAVLEHLFAELPIGTTDTGDDHAIAPKR
ncbi:hypothetical protein CJO80_27125 (plasmid) [Ralstonia solanacearum]|nr:hypothetical protein CJO80_27125 [Ralstonia solanacearum]